MSTLGNDEPAAIFSILSYVIDYFFHCQPKIPLVARARVQKKNPRARGFFSGSPGKTRTYNPSVNSRMLCH